LGRGHGDPSESAREVEGMGTQNVIVVPPERLLYRCATMRAVVTRARAALGVGRAASWGQRGMMVGELKAIPRIDRRAGTGGRRHGARASV